MAWIRDTRNMAWIAGVAALVIVLFAMQIWTASLVTLAFYPKGTPLTISSINAATNRPHAIGEYFRVTLVGEKRRDCEPHAQMVWVNSASEERPFLIENWPYVEPGSGTRALGLWLQVPEVLQPGKFRLQVRGLWRCQEEYYPITSPTTEIEIVEAPSPP